MKVKQLKRLLEQFDDDQTVVIANYSEEDGDGNMPCHTIEGAEPLPITMEPETKTVNNGVHHNT